MVFGAAMRLLIALPLLLILVLFALSNTAPVRLRLWPTDYALELPLSLAVLGAMAIAFLARRGVWCGCRNLPSDAARDGRSTRCGCWRRRCRN